MDNDFALALHICLSGSAILQGRSAAAAAFSPNSTTLRYINEMTFERRLKSRWETIAQDIHEWLTLLKNEGCRQLVLRQRETVGDLPKQAEAVFPDSSPWELIGAVKKKETEWWQSDWQAFRTREHRNWQVAWRSAGTSATPGQMGISISLARSNLKNSLQQATAFAKKNRLELWCEWFADAIEQLSSRTPSFKFFSDLQSRELLDLEEMQLLATATHSWVFGGMGSWNDHWFEDAKVQKQYEAVSRDLYGAMMLAFMSALDQATRVRKSGA